MNYYEKQTQKRENQLNRITEIMEQLPPYYLRMLLCDALDRLQEAVVMENELTKKETCHESNLEDSHQI